MESVNGFLAEIDFRDKLCNLLRLNVIDLDEQNIKEIYERLQANFQTDNFQLLPSLVYDKLKIRKEQNISNPSFLLGIDFPIWFSPSKKTEKKIMIIGIDPLRNEKTFKRMKARKEKDVIIGTPYAIHDAKIRKGRTKQYWGLINKLAEENLVYVTDIYKVFFYTNDSPKERSYIYYKKEREKKDRGQNNSADQDNHMSLLKKEIEMIQPDFIIIFGRETYRQLWDGKCTIKLTDSINKNQRSFGAYTVLPMVHLSGATRQNYILDFLTNNKIMYDASKNYGEQYFDIILNYRFEKES